MAYLLRYPMMEGRRLRKRTILQAPNFVDGTLVIWSPMKRPTFQYHCVGSCISTWVLEGNIHSSHCNVQYISSPPTVAPCVTVTMVLWSEGARLPSSVIWSTREPQNWSVSIVTPQHVTRLLSLAFSYFLPLDFWTLRTLVLRGVT